MAGYFFGEDQPDVAAEVQVAVEGELTRIIQGEESLWYDRKLIDGFRAAGPGRGYYGKQRGWIAGDKVSRIIRRYA